MTITLIVIVAILAVFLGWILSQSFNVEPWVATEPTSSTLDRLPEFFTTRRVGLAVFLGAISSLFALTISAYSGRMHMADDWVSLAAPKLLWFNTAVLLLGSVALHRAWRAASRSSDTAMLKFGLAAGGVCTIIFVLGQFMVWRQLHADGFALASNPANSFFYFVTALHAAHVIGGLVAWTIAMIRVFKGQDPVAIRTTVELCTIYWHYLLVVWAILFGLILFS